MKAWSQKRLESVYEPGRRSGAWVKVKVDQGQELVIGGYKLHREVPFLVVEADQIELGGRDNEAG